DPQVVGPGPRRGVPALVRAAPAGNVGVANGIGNGIGADKLTYPYGPDLLRYYLAEEPTLPNVDTGRLEEPESRAEVLDRLEELVVKPVDGSGGKGIVIGPAATVEELDALRARLQDDPRGWIAQPVVQPSTIPTLGEEGPEPRHGGLRALALSSGDDVWGPAGRLTRVALPRGRGRVEGHLGAGGRAPRRPGPLGLGRTGAGGRGRGDRGPHRRQLRGVRGPARGAGRGAGARTGPRHLRDPAHRRRRGGAP